MIPSSKDVGLRRRVLFFLLAPLALVVLVFVGSRPSQLAAAATGDADAADVGGGETPSEAALTPETPAETASTSAVEIQADGAVLVDLNRASEDELRKLPGIGPRKAKSIVELRARLGGLKRIEDLARIKGFGRATIHKLRPFVRLAPK